MIESHQRYRTVPSTFSAREMAVSLFKRTFFPLEKVTILVYMLLAFSLMNSSLLCSPVDKVARVVVIIVVTMRRVHDRR